jgi:GMP synthase-like glutamine amidotransferase
MGSAPPPLRIAILECDTPQPITQSRFGGYAGVFTALLAAASDDNLPALASLSAHDVVNDPDAAYPDLAAVDALLITGSKHTAWHDDPWILKLVEYTRRAVEGGRVKVLGICFGHQILGRAMGAHVAKNPQGWEVAVTNFDLTPKGKEILALGDKDQASIQQMHSDAVLTVPEGAHLLGSNAACAIQGLYLPGRYLTVQGHPEFTNDIVSEILTNRHKTGVFPDDVFREGMSRAPAHHDGVAIGRAFLRFLREE